MFQSFESSRDTARGRERTRQLRARLKARDLDGFVVPRADAHQNEFVPPSEERLLWLTGFSGSAGTAVVLARTAALFVDGRYTLQARRQVDTDVFDIRHITEEPLGEWLQQALKPGQRLGFDPWLHTVEQTRRLRKACARADAELVEAQPNPLDEVWQERPPPPAGLVNVHPLKYAGKAPAEKIAEVRSALAETGAQACVLTQPDSICWLLNIRGHDLPHTPVALAFAIVPARGKPQLFIAPRKLNAEARAYLAPLAALKRPGRFEDALEALAKKDARVCIDPAGTAFAIARRLRDAGAETVHGPDPCLLPKAAKTAAEVGGARAAHLRDGIALTRFLAWLAREAPAGKLTEIEAARRLEAFRAETGRLKDLSFDTISGAGPNGAIVHYRVSEESNRRLTPGSLYLVDSGAQYPDGTTDVTRTVAVGEPTREMCEHFTLVLRGHIAIARARFPEGTTGAQLDSLARVALWRHGLDYDHGTGHGVGSYLAVHEGPQRISKLGGGTALVPGMIVSNEPGYYRKGRYGIRIENLVLVSPARGRYERNMLEFETLTLAPIDRRLILAGGLDAEERDWLDRYHRRVREAIGPQLDAEDRTWLDRATAPLDTG